MNENTLSAQSKTLPPIPVRMLNEFVYCPRLAYLEWVQGEFVHSADTVEGKIKHKRVDQKEQPLPDDPEQTEKFHARSVSLSSDTLGISCRIDLVEGRGKEVVPVDYKKGKRPHVAGGAYDPEKVQLCAQALLLREHGYSCGEGIIYFAGSRERVTVPMEQDLIDKTLEAIRGISRMAASGNIAPPLQDSPKCPRCSLVGVCLPDEIGFLNKTPVQPRPIVPALETTLPLYVQSPRAYVRKSGERLVVEENREKVADVPFGEVSQVVLYGNSALTTPALHECIRRGITVTYLSYGGWFMGHVTGMGHRNVEIRTCQYKASEDEKKCLKLARQWVAAKIANCRTLLRRNWKFPEDSEEAAEAAQRDQALDALMTDLKNATRAKSLESLRGVEGVAGARYFQNLTRMFKSEDTKSMGFDFKTRNRRPPKDPVNAMLSFGYAMLTRQWTVTLIGVGLDPYRGFYHQPRFGRPSLALDMMEPFRPLIADSAVVTVINNGQVRPEDFTVTNLGCNLNERARKRFIAAFERRMATEVTHPIFKYRISCQRLLEVQARLLIRYLAGEIPRYPNFITR